MTMQRFAIPMLYSPDGDGGGTTGTPPGTGGTTPPSPAEPPKFTQADVDRLLGERAKRSEEATQKQILEALGVKSVEELKKLKEDAETLQAAQLSDLQKAQKDAADAKAKIAEAEKARAAALDQATEMLMRSAVLAEATKADYHIRPEAMTDVWGFIRADKTLLEKIKAKEGADPGEFTGVPDALKELLKTKTYMLVETGGSQGTPRGGGTHTVPRASDYDAAALEAKRRRGNYGSI